MTMTNLTNVNIVDINWDKYALAEENYAAFDADGELLFSERSFTSIKCRMWVSSIDSIIRRTGEYPFGVFDFFNNSFKDFDSIVYSREYIKINDDVYKIEHTNPNEQISINDEDSYEQKIDKLYAMMDAIENVIDILSSEQANINEPAQATAPDWSKAPSWANWWAVDSEDGDAWFFENEPMLKSIDDGDDDFVIYWDIATTETESNRLDVDVNQYLYYNELNFHKSLTKRPV